MQNLRNGLVLLLALLALPARARDEQLVRDMTVLEKAYINPLFFTSNQHLAKTLQTFPALQQEWAAFSAAYRAYRPDAANWSERFDAVDEAIARTEAIVVAARAACAANAPGAPCPQLVPAHDALEAVRYELLDLRSHNGFPKFVTDKLTRYHDPMEALVLTFKDLQAWQITDEMLAAAADALAECDFLWSTVERTPIDDAWGLGAAQLAELQLRVAAERAALDALAAAVGAADRAAIPGRAVALKQRFVPVYTAFAGDPLLNRLP